MRTLSVIGVEDGCVIAASDTGERFRIPIEAQVRARLNDARPAPAAKRLSPREIQAHIRAGLSVQQVASLTGAPTEAIEAFAVPIMAEREYVVESALAVRVHTADADDRPRPFGVVLTERLESLAATAIRWSSAKTVGAGWVLQLAFVADEIEHEARWQVDLKRMQLTPENMEATTLSQLGTPAALTPRLRALDDEVARHDAAAKSDDPAEEPAVDAFEALARTDPATPPVAEAEAPTAPVAVAPESAFAPVRVGRTSTRAPRQGGSAPAAEPSTRARRPSTSRTTPPVGDSTAPLGLPETAQPSPAAERAVPQQPPAAEQHTVQEPPATEPIATAGPDTVDFQALRAQRPAKADDEGPRAGLVTTFDGKRRRAEPAPSAPPEPFDPFGEFDDDEDEDPFLPKPAPERDEPAHVTRGRFPDALPKPEPKAPQQPLKRPRSRGGLRRREPAATQPEQAASDESAAASPAEESAPPAPGRPRRGRTTMPSWDEIVYGRDDD